MSVAGLWRGRVSKAIVAALVVMLGAAALASWGTRSVVRDQESRLLKERASEVSLLFTSVISGVMNSLTSYQGVLRATDDSSVAFTKAATTDVAFGKASSATVALLRPAPSGGYRVVAVSGPLLKIGQAVSGDLARTFDQARASNQLVSTRVMGTGVNRMIGFALNASGVLGDPGGLVIYRESTLGRLSAPRQTGSAPFHEINAVLYVTPHVDRSQLLVSTVSGELPAHGSLFVTQPVGASTWLLGVRAKSSLVGGIASNAWWIVLLGGIAGALLLAGMIQFAIRRRDAALELYAAEHQQAETLQRSLLPVLPQLPGLELAVRYQAGAVGQQVGGDWFDAFALDGGGVGFAIGDVIGHDLKAAAAMSQIRAALRAYAYEGDEPALVISRLDRLVCTFELTQLVSVVYGVLSPIADDGTRTVRFANAGHLPPLLQDPGGSVTVLSEGASVVIGAPFSEPRAQAQRLLVPGSTLLLFTDGLLEAPDLSLSETIPQLAETVAGHTPSDGCEVLCERVLASRRDLTQRDDIALLAVRLRQAPAKSPLPRAGGEVRELAPQITGPPTP